jgi:hypothetical protein
VANVRNRFRTVAIKGCLSFNFAVFFDFILFPVPPSKPKLIGVVQINRQNAANWPRVPFLQKIFDEKIQRKNSCKKSSCNKVTVVKISQIFLRSRSKFVCEASTS